MINSSTYAYLPSERGTKMDGVFCRPLVCSRSQKDRNRVRQIAWDYEHGATCTSPKSAEASYVVFQNRDTKGWAHSV